MLGYEGGGLKAQRGEEREEGEKKTSTLVRQIGPGCTHERSMIRGTRTRGNWTAGGCPVGESG